MLTNDQSYSKRNDTLLGIFNSNILPYRAKTEESERRSALGRSPHRRPAALVRRRARRARARPRRAPPAAAAGDAGGETEGAGSVA